MAEENNNIKRAAAKIDDVIVEAIHNCEFERDLFYKGFKRGREKTLCDAIKLIIEEIKKNDN